jgi:hypothetical protein
VTQELSEQVGRPGIGRHALERGKRKAGLGQRESLRLDLEPPVPADRRSFQAVGPLACDQRDEIECVVQREPAQLARRELGGEEVAVLDRVRKSPVCGSLRRHEHMFARAVRGTLAPEELQDPLPRDAHDPCDGVEGHPRFARRLDRRSEGLPGFVDIVLGLSGSIDGAA